MIKELRYLLLVAALIFLYGCFTAFQAFMSGELLYLLWSAISYAATISLLLKKQWSKYLVYVFSLLLVGGWAAFTIYVAGADMPNQQEYLMRLLILGVVLSIISLVSSVYVHNYFKSNSNK